MSEPLKPLMEIDARAKIFTCLLLPYPTEKNAKEIADLTGYTYDYVRGILVEMYELGILDRRPERKSRVGKPLYNYWIKPPFLPHLEKLREFIGTHRG